MKTTDEKITALLSQMTLKEKIGQLAQKFMGFKAYTRDENGELLLTDEFKDYVKKYDGLGILYGLLRADPWSKRDYAHGGIQAHEREKAYNLVQKFIIENTRLGIPVLFEEEAPHGWQALDTVLYPVNLNIGCSFNVGSYEKEAKEIGKEAVLSGRHISLISVFDMALDPRWGRFEECFSEDPYLASKLSAAAVRGINQSGSMICCKHFAAQGGALGGHNGGITNIGERELREIHLPSAESAVKEGCDFIMVAYNEIDGVPCHLNAYLLNDILRDEFGFDGVTHSDGCALDMLMPFCRNDAALVGASALKAGVDTELWGFGFVNLEEAVAKNYVSEADIDKAVYRLLKKKFECGLMEHPYVDEGGASENYAKSGVAEKVAYEIASESLVLLKNNDVLPLKEQKVLVIGENLDNIYYMLGDYTSEQKNATTLRKIFCENGATYIEGWNFIDGITVSDQSLNSAVSEADVIIFGMGGSSARDFNSQYNSAGAIIKAKNTFMDCGEGVDLAELSLTDGQLKLLEKLSAYNKPIISLIIAGRAYNLSEVEKYSSAMLWCGYPGSQGAKAIFDTLYGTKNSFGRLSFSLPASVGQLPVWYNIKASSRYSDISDKALFPFGYGLSYSKFEYFDFKLSPASLEDISNGASIDVSFKVKNVSEISGKAVPQLYINRNGGTVTHRRKELRGFDKIALDPGETKEVKFKLGYDDLKEWSVAKKYEIQQMLLTVMVGSSSEEILWKEILELK